MASDRGNRKESASRQPGDTPESNTSDGHGAAEPGTRRRLSPLDESDALEEEARNPRGAIPELMRKAFELGFSGLFMTEGAIRKALGDTMPRDWIDFAVDQSERTRVELLERVSFEVGRAIESVDVAEVLSEVMEGRTIEIKTEIRLGPKQDPE